jgi:GAF domain-containing protein/HAMP domain-containing protein
MAVILLAVTAISAVNTIYVGFYRDWPWQLALSAVINVALSMVILGRLRLIRQGRPEVAIRDILVAILVTGLLLSALLAGVGLVIALAIVLLSWSMTAQILPQRQINLTLLASFGVGIATAALELWAPPFQLVVPQIQTTSPIFAVIIAVAYLGLVIWQFRSYNLHTKLIAIVLVVSILSAGAVAILSNQATGEALRANVGANLESRATVQALAVGDLLVGQLDALRALSLSKNLRDGVVVHNSSYVGSQAVIEAGLRKRDEQWRTARDTDLLVQARLDPRFSPIAAELLEFRELFPAHVEIMVTDRYGGLVAATNRTSDYYQADETWWQATFNKGQGGSYIGQPEIDESSATLGLTIAVPVYSQDQRQLVGVVKSIYKLSDLAALFNLANQRQASHLELLLPRGQLLAFSGNVRIEASEAETWRKLAGSSFTGYQEVDINRQPYLLSLAPVRTSTESPVVAYLRWGIVAYQPQVEALLPVTKQTQATLFLTLAIIGITTGIAMFISHQLAGPIVRLTGTAQNIASGDLSARARVETNDEVGVLASTFNAMTGQLRETIDTLEERVAERTRELQTVVNVSHRLASILDISDLLRQVVNTTKETFDYYHVHIYLLDELGQTLSLAEGYGEAGAALKQQGHDIPLAAFKSLVARAAREGQIIRVENVREAPDWLPNPLLPETQAEMAVPIQLGHEVVGVLDVQSAQVGGLTQEDEVTLQILANQIAVAVRNARLFSQTQDALYQAQKLQRLYTGQAWEKLAASRATTSYEFHQPTLTPLGDTPPPEAVAALEQEQTVEFRLPKINLEFKKKPAGGPVGPQDPAEVTQTKSVAALATPLKLREEIVGVLGVHADNLDRQWTNDEIALIEAVSEQMSLAIENARLFEETGRRAGRERIIAQVTRQVWASGELERVMKTAIEQLGTTLEASKVVIRLGTEDQLLAKKEETLS